MNKKTISLIFSIAALISFFFCFMAGIWIPSKVGLDRANDLLSTAIGLYFIGKAFFVGPTLYISSKLFEK